VRQRRPAPLGKGWLGYVTCSYHPKTGARAYVVRDASPGRGQLGLWTSAETNSGVSCSGCPQCGVHELLDVA
jgi:hypothetical protein